ncbi:hypothetical protein YC2023_109355 [Brassica napus]
MAPNNNRCKWSSIFMLLLSLSLAVSVAVATDKAPLVEDARRHGPYGRARIRRFEPHVFSLFSCSYHQLSSKLKCYV